MRQRIKGPLVDSTQIHNSLLDTQDRELEVVGNYQFNGVGIMNKNQSLVMLECRSLVYLHSLWNEDGTKSHDIYFGTFYDPQFDYTWPIYLKCEPIIKKGVINEGFH